MAYIYKITNKVNGKSYIGKTLKSVEDRFNEHCKERLKERCKNRPLYRAMNKYGIENFEVSVLEEVTDKMASEREIFWIDHFGTYSKGYNATKGGDGKQLIDHDKVIELAKTKTASEIAKELCCDVSSVNLICRLNKVATLKSDTSSKIRVPIVAVEMNTLFSSYSDASDYLSEKSIRRNISSCISGKRKKAAGFSWVKASDHLVITIN